MQGPLSDPRPPAVRALTTHAEQRHGRGAGRRPPRRRTRPLPLSFQQVPRLLSLSAPQVWPLLMVHVAGSVLPLPRTRSNSHRLRGFPIVISAGRQAGDWARHRGAIAGKQEQSGPPPSTPHGIRASAWTSPTRGPASQPINSRPVHRPRPSTSK